MNNNPYEPGNQSPYGPYQGGNPPTPPPPPPPTYQGGNSLPTYPQASDPYAQTFPMNSYMSQPILPPIMPPPTNPRGGRNKTLLIVIVTALVLVVVIGSIVSFLAVRNAISNTPAKPTPVPYPSLAGAYSGLAHNITYNQDAEMAMTTVVEDATGKISGSIQFGLPLVGSNAFSGTVSRTNAIQFVIVSTGAGGTTTSTFNGLIDKQGSMSGTYIISNKQNGTWKASPNPSPLVYPLLFANYSGNFYNNSTAKSGVMTLTIITQNQKNFTGMFDSTISVSGTVGTDNSIQFAGTDTKGEPITFSGTINVDSSLNGTYKAGGSVTGTWKVSPGTK